MAIFFLSSAVVGWWLQQQEQGQKRRGGGSRVVACGVWGFVAHAAFFGFYLVFFLSKDGHIHADALHTHTALRVHLLLGPAVLGFGNVLIEGVNHGVYVSLP